MHKIYTYISNLLKFWRLQIQLAISYSDAKYKIISITPSKTRQAQNSLVEFINIKTLKHHQLEAWEIAENHDLISSFDSSSCSKLGKFLGTYCDDKYI